VTWTGALLAGIAGRLDAQGVGKWRASGRYQPADVRPIVLTAVPAAPDEMLVLTPYSVDEDALLNDVTQGVQVRTRASRDPRALDALNDAVFDALHGLSGVVLNGVPVVLIYRQSAAYLGVDGNGRHEASQNYYVQAARPSTHRTD
jgi:hypothetical protein